MNISKELVAEIAMHLQDIDIFKGKCDCQSQKHTRAYLSQKGLSSSDIDDVTAYLESFGGYCDCEVLMNAIPAIFPTDEEFYEYVDKVLRKRKLSSEARR